MTEGARFGRYQLIRVVGSGGMANVHLARQIGPSGFVKPCVLKCIAPDVLHDDSVRRMFLEEARISALLNHPHIVQTFDYGEENGVPYMAMELVDGVNLSQLCRTLAAEGRWIPLRTCVEIGASVLDALAYAHALSDLDGKSLRLVHRDVSPQNILLSRQGGVKLSDFGIARHDARQEVTQGLAAKGKPGYMAPEQALGLDVDGRADLFALGIVLTELISARRVKGGTQQLVAGLGELEKRIRDLLDLRKDATEPLKAFALKLTSLERDDRHRSAKEASDELRKIVEKLPQRDALPVFLEKVFAGFFPDGPLVQSGQTTATPGTIPKVDPNAAEIDKTKVDPVIAHLPKPPESKERNLAFETEQWTRRDPIPAHASAQVYEGGWPKQLVEEKADIELVSKSSSVEAMQYFAAQGGQAPSPVASQAMKGHRVPYVFDYSPKRTPAPTGTEGQGAGNAGAPLSPQLPQMPKVLLGLKEEDQDKPKKKLPPWVPLAGIGVGVGLLAFGVLLLVSPSEKKSNKPLPTLGSILVSSEPAGAAIFIDGQKTAYVTPSEIQNLPLESPIRVFVAMERHLAVPQEASVQIPSSTQKTTASFTLKPARFFELYTEPPGASVEIEGQKASGITPMTLPGIAIGDTSTLTLTLEGYMPMVMKLHARADTPTVARAKLELGRIVDVVSEPPNAKVFIDGTPRGVTPLYDLMVPAARAFKVRVEKKGYKKWQKVLSPKTLHERLVEADLQTLPLLAMPLSKEDMQEAKDLDRKVARIASDIRKNKGLLDNAERKLARVEASPNIFIARIADAQKTVDELRYKLDQLEQEQQEVDGQVVEFRQKVMAKIDGSEP